MHTIVRVSTWGRLVIPAELRRKYKIKPGTKADLSENAFGGIVLTIRDRRRTRQVVGKKK